MAPISFTFVRFRGDKVHANSTRTALNVWKDIKNPIPEETLLGQDMSMLFFVTNPDEEGHHWKDSQEPSSLTSAQGEVIY